MSRARTTGPVMAAPTHSHPEGIPCFVMNECAIHTVTLPEGAFSAIVHACEGPTGGVAVIAILDHDEVEEHIRLLRNAVEDAKRLDNGLKGRPAASIEAPPSPPARPDQGEKVRCANTSQ